MQSRRRVRIETRTLHAVLALAALTIGVLVYVFERDPRRVALLGALFASPAAHDTAPGPLSDWLPSFVHVYAFILLSAAVTRPWRARALALSLSWWLLESLFEILQHPALRAALAEVLATAWGPIPGAPWIIAHLRGGTFDPGDLAALAIGACAAYLTLVPSAPDAERRHA